MDLAEKQEYYEYLGGWSYKHPPRLDLALFRRLHEIDPNLHLIWGGVVIVRNEPDGQPVKLLGDARATKRVKGRLMPRWPSRSVATFTGYTFKLKNGREKTVMREDQVPRSKRKVCVAKFEFCDYGRLRWYLTRLLTPEQAVAAQIFAADDPDIPADGYYFCNLTVETPDKRYWEPDRDWLEMIAASNHETFNTPLADLYYRDHAITEAREALRDAMRDNQTCMPPEELLKFTIDQGAL